MMRTDDLRMLFKNSAFKPDDIKAYVINLLNKFEVALLYDDENLLIPSLLPTESETKTGVLQAKVLNKYRVLPIRGILSDPCATLRVI